MSRESARDWYIENRDSPERRRRCRKASRKWYRKHRKEHIERSNRARDLRRKGQTEAARVKKRSDEELDQEALRWIEQGGEPLWTKKTESD